MNLTETNQLNQTLDLMITPMMLTNEASMPVYINQAFQSLVGYGITEVSDKDSWLEKAYPDESYREKVIKSWTDVLATDSKNGAEPVHVISKIYCADGVSRWFDVHQHSIGNKHALTFLNVDELKQYQEDLEDIVQQKERLLCIVAHDVRSPLCGIKQIVSSYDAINLSELNLKDLFFSLGDQVDHVFNILNSLLIRASDDRGRLMERQEMIALKIFFSKYLTYYKERLKKRNIDLILELSENAVLNYDPGILDVICRNLLDNAIKYSAENGVICISYKKAGSKSSLLIRDTGPGMSVEQVDSIIHNKVSYNTHKQLTDGFGLGLAMAKEILEKYHGRLSVKSEIGIGTSFIIDIIDHSLN